MDPILGFCSFVRLPRKRGRERKRERKGIPSFWRREENENEKKR
jgi:hypothetical protein